MPTARMVLSRSQRCSVNRRVVGPCPLMMFLQAHRDMPDSPPDRKGAALDGLSDCPIVDKRTLMHSTAHTAGIIPLAAISSFRSGSLGKRQDVMRLRRLRHALFVT